MEDFKDKYNEALERARKIHNDTEFEYEKGMMEEIFPELANNEDEENKKWILEYLYDGLRKSDEQFKEEFKCAIAWLEKQKESVDNTKYDKKIEDYSKVQRICKYLNEVKKYCGDINEIRECIDWLKSLVKLSEEPKIQKGKRYICTNSHKYAGHKWIKNDVYTAVDDYTLFSQGTEYFCPEYSNEKHNEYFKEYDSPCKDKRIREIIIKALTGEIRYLSPEDTNECVEWLKSFDENKKES